MAASAMNSFSCANNFMNLQYGVPFPNNHLQSAMPNPKKIEYFGGAMTSISISKTISEATTTVRESMKSALSMGMNIGGGGNKDVGTLHYTDMVPWNNNGNKETHEFLQRLTQILLEFIDKTNDRNEKVLDFHQPDQLVDIMDFSLPDDPQNLDQLLTDCKDALKYQVKTGHPHFYNQLSCGLDTVSMAGEWLTATANTNMFTYEIAPVFILMESFVLKKMREIIGFTNGDSILAPGGTMSNLYAIIVARHKKFPKYKIEGLRALPSELVMFTSEHCHYSIKSAAMVTGLGTGNCVSVPADERGKMIPAELERLVLKARAEGKHPYFVNCTSGSTVFGAFDPLNEIAEICEKYDLWLHVDGAWGGGLLVSEKYRHPRFDGLERADSITWNPHKLLTTALQCSTVHFKEAGLLESCNQMCADYLFQQDKGYDVRYDTGDKVIQCGRHNDIFKFWLQWRAKGTKGLGQHADHLMEMNEYLMAKMRSMPDKFHIIVKNPEYVNACFWYIPKRLRSMPHGPERERLLGDTCPIIKQKMMERGTLMIGYQPQGHLPNFFRSIISNPAVKKPDIDFMLAELDRIGEDL